MKNSVLHFTLVALLLLSSSNLLAQDCNFDKDETDPFTKEHVRSTKQMRLSGTPRWWALLEQKGTKYTLTLNVFMLKEVRASIAAGTKIQAKLENGTLLELITENDALPTFNVENNTMIVSQWTVNTNITADALKQLSTSPIELMRTTIGSNDCNMPSAHKKGVESLMKFAGCMLSNK